jgi:hypothetical protein
MTQKGPASRPLLERVEAKLAQAIEPIMPMPPHIIIIGMPFSIMVVMRLQASMNMSLDASSIGIISQAMPLGVILQVIFIIIMGIMPPMGIPPPIIIGFIMGIIPPIIGIMPIIIGFIIGIMPFIIGIIPGIMLPIIGMFGICIAAAIVCSVDLARPALRRPSMATV